MKPVEAKVTIDIENTQKLKGAEVVSSKKYLHQLKGVFGDDEAFRKMDTDQLVYEVQAYMPVKEGKSGGLFFGNTLMHPGKVGDEYFMTRGHFHANKDTAEYYWCIKGEGALIMMDMDRNCWYEKMEPGTLHYIPGNVAHRVANTGEEILFFNACWPSDAGHDYDNIENHGFSERLLEIDGKPQLI